MKITSNLFTVESAKSASAGGARADSERRVPPGGETADRDIFWSYLRTLESNVAREGEFDAWRVEKLKRALREGKLSMSPEAVADKLIANAIDAVSKK